MSGSKSNGGDSTSSLTRWVALVGVGGALLGSLIGAGASVWISERSVDAQREATALEREEQAYSRYLTTVVRINRQLARALVETPKVDPESVNGEGLTEALQLARPGVLRISRLSGQQDRALADLVIYGEREAVDAAYRLSDRIDEALRDVTLAIVLGTRDNSERANTAISDLETRLRVFAVLIEDVLPDE